MTRFTLSAVLAALMLAAAPVQAEGTMDHSGHGTGAMGAMGAMGPSTQAYMDANDKMHGAMAIEFTGDADVDFIRGMIPHHQGAVEMARIVLEHGQDPEVRKLAEGVIAAQEAEIKWMQDWLKARGY